jgi:hypothetical protein
MFVKSGFGESILVEKLCRKIMECTSQQIWNKLGYSKINAWMLGGEGKYL